jgi:hypothetical protein
MLSARPNRSNDMTGSKDWTPGNADGWPHAFYMCQGRRPHVRAHIIVCQNVSPGFLLSSLKLSSFPS